MSEHDIQSAIIVTLSDRVDWFRNNVGCYDANPECPHCGKRKVLKYGKRWVHYGVGGPGGADLVGLERGTGRLVVCEVKRPGERPREDQEAFLERIRLSGGIAFWADSVRMAVEGMR